MQPIEKETNTEREKVVNKPIKSTRAIKQNMFYPKRFLR